jgi:hypothetical protein
MPSFTEIILSQKNTETQNSAITYELWHDSIFVHLPTNNVPNAVTTLFDSIGA